MPSFIMTGCLSSITLPMLCSVFRSEFQQTWERILNRFDNYKSMMPSQVSLQTAPPYPSCLIISKTMLPSKTCPLRLQYYAIMKGICVLSVAYIIAMIMCSWSCIKIMSLCLMEDSLQTKHVFRLKAQSDLAYFLFMFIHKLEISLLWIRQIVC